MIWQVLGSAALVGIGLFALWRAVATRRNTPGQTWPSDAQQHVDDVLLTLPGGGLCALAAGVVLGGDLPRDVAALIVTFLLVPGILMILTAVVWRTPLWWVPRWARERVRHRRQVEKRRRRRRRPEKR